MARTGPGLAVLARRLAALVAAVLICLPSVALAREVPALRGHVNDDADMLSSAAEQALERKLSTYEGKSQHQFALLTIDSLEGDALEDFSIRVVEAWKLGKKGKDDGLLLLLVEQDHKLRIEVGYGLEGDITDAFSARLIRNVLTPALRAGQVEPGVDQAFDALMAKASGQAVAVGDPASAEPPSRRSSPLGMLVLLLIALPFLLPLLLGRVGRRRGGFLMGGLGGLGGYGWGGGYGGSGRGHSSGGGFGGGGGGFGGGGASGSW